MKFWLVSIFEVTPLDDNQNTRFNSISREVIRQGHDVTFWASTFRHNVKKQRYEETRQFDVNEHLKAVYLKSIAYAGNISVKRLYSHYHYAKNLIAAFDKAGEKPDVIVVAFPPISVAYDVVKWARKRNIPVIVDIIDPWPDVFKPHFSKLPGILSSIMFYPLTRKVKKIMADATGVMSISNQYLDWAREYNPRITDSACFYPAIEFQQMQEQLREAAKKVEKNNDSFRVIYAGSLGFSYDIPTILNAAAMLHATHGRKIIFTIVGDGPQKELVQSFEKKYDNVRYTGRLTKNQLMEEYFASDMGMTQHIHGATQSVTYKLFDLLACGLPILNSLESEMKDIILQHRVGLHNRPGDAGGLAANILRAYENPALITEMRSNAVALTREKGDARKVYREAVDFLIGLRNRGK